MKPVELSVQKVTVWSLWQEMSIVPTRTEANTTPTAEKHCPFTWYASSIDSYPVTNVLFSHYIQIKKNYNCYKWALTKFKIWSFETFHYYAVAIFKMKCLVPANQI